ncbi:SgcJ/EcaC family oxidoreductase [Nocardia cyriacigeorgica]|uniref:SgcJ/EcaC family oxidoreductase n=1 Tax=Nocardia cyriacigeorgica TaxID=135487 RepID=UPI001893E45E|nr:SgcJ/EcaC family oxidoreductase [Nocardia cyriacigeorgica]MBF6316955.1 SgcJ/EcaC family oxidoreductase [Nocardia cyriacigeorgica]MBF6345586.1 SgcJ/EcaC family oxidoreductase [Nocardia cyriacigeorgica]MBF6532493.1 SgcJ/EcaC family oxidoreductase [Nocardia cyriacigeorgica]
MTDDITTETELRALLQAQIEAWAAADGAAFADTFTEDAVFVSVIGEYIPGRAAIATTMQEGLNGFMKGTRMPEPEVLNLRFPAPDTAILITRSGRPAPPDTTPDPDEKSIQTRVALRREGRWLFSSFQNTRIGGFAPPAN